ncbi:MAG: 60S ribosomal protein L38 [Desulfurococcales archaeon]|nr:60S ribosomal protein L38 [Desulfurococcales archaeon]
MPVEVKDLEKFREIAGRAVECRVKKVRNKDIVKIKARTKRYLYTIKVEASKAEEIINSLPCKKIVYVDEGRVVEKK